MTRHVAFGLPGLPVDTHVARLTKLLGLTDSIDPVRIESDVCALLPRSEWGAFSLRLILHGRRVCDAKRPKCDVCVLNDFCPSSSTRATNKRSRIKLDARARGTEDKRRVRRAAVSDGRGPRRL